MSKLRLLLAAVTAIVAFATYATPASADTAEIDPGGRMDLVSVGRITFGIGVTVACNLTLSGSLATSANVWIGAIIGSVTATRFANCSGGSISSMNDLPWPIRLNEIWPYFGLNDILWLGLDLPGLDVTFSVFGGFVNCRYEGTGRAILELVDTGTNTYNVADFILDESTWLPRIGGSGLCPGETNLAGTLRFGLGYNQRLVAI